MRLGGLAGSAVGILVLASAPAPTGTFNQVEVSGGPRPGGSYSRANEVFTP